MKLRNKKTGEIKQIVRIDLTFEKDDIWFTSLTEVNKEWEDYKPAELCGEEEECLD